METRVIAVDVGSVLTNFAWAGLDLPGRRLVSGGGARPDEAAVSVLAALTSGIRVALGFEAPLVIPVSPVDQVDGWKTLGKARQGETVDGRSRPWSAGAGSGALAKGLMQMAWVLERVGSELPGMACTTRPEVWLSGESGLLVWEAFVSGTGKPVPAGPRSTPRTRRLPRTPSPTAWRREHWSRRMLCAPRCHRSILPPPRRHTRT